MTTEILPEEQGMPPIAPEAQPQAPDAPIVAAPEQPPVFLEDEAVQVARQGAIRGGVKKLKDALWSNIGLDQRIENVGMSSEEDAEEMINRTQVGHVVDPARTPARNFNVRHFQTTDDIKQWIDDAAETVAEIDHTPQTHEETLQGAVRAKVDLEDLVQGKVDGKLWNAKQMTKARARLVQEGARLSGMAKDMLVDVNGRMELRTDISQEEQWAFRKALSEYAAVQKTLAGQVKEAGRLLNALQIDVGPDMLRQVNIQDELNRIGGGKATARLAEMIANANGDPAAIARIAKGTKLQRFNNFWLEIYYNSMLSGVGTHMRNTLGNALVAANSTAERYVAAAWGMPARWRGAKDTVTWTEANAYAIGQVQGILFGFKQFARAMKDPQGVKGLLDPGHVSYAEAYRPRGVSADNIGLGGLKGGRWSAVASTIDFLGDHVINAPGNLLRAEDEFFKSIGYAGELNARAVRRLIADGVEPNTDEFYKRLKELVDFPPEDLHLEAVQHARAVTFTNDLGTTETGQRGWLADQAEGVQKIQNTPIARLFVPFLRTPTNIMKYGANRSPLAITFPSFWQDLFSGSARRDLALSRLSAGSTIAGMFALGASHTVTDEDGNLHHRPLVTGAGPANWEMRKLWMESGWRPYSIWDAESQTYKPYDWAEPLGTVIGGIATAMEIRNNTYDDRLKMEMEEAIVMAIAEYTTDKMYLQGFAEMLDMLQGGGPTVGDKAAGVISTMLTPAIGAAFRKDTDEVVRYTKGGTFMQTLVNKMMNRVPGWSDELPPAVSVWGDDILYGDPAWGMHGISPYMAYKAKGDQVTFEVMRLSKDIGGSFNHFSERKPDPILTIEMPDGSKVKVPVLEMERGGHLYADYLKLVGKARRAEVEQVVFAGHYESMGENEKFNEVSAAFNRGKQDIDIMVQPFAGYSGVSDEAAKFREKYGDELQLEAERIYQRNGQLQIHKGMPAHAPLKTRF